MAIAILNDFLNPNLSAGAYVNRQALAANFENSLSKLIEKISFLATGSGSEALLRIFESCARHTEKRTVAMAAYACPQVALAAQQAGFQILPLEIDAHTIEPRFDVSQLDTCAAVVLNNLYGLPDSIREELRQRRDSLVIIDDACQSFLSSAAGEQIGTRADTIGAISFGRGKPLAGLGGGGIIFREDTTQRSTLREAVLADLVKSSPFLSEERGNFSQLLMACIFWGITRPGVFALLMRIPGVDLGKPTCPDSIVKAKFSDFQRAYVAQQLERVALRKETFNRNTLQWARQLKPCRELGQPFVARNLENEQSALIRYPIICPSESTARSAEAALHRIGIGATRGYRQTLEQWPQLKNFSKYAGDTALAAAVGQQLLLLPTHSQVRELHFERGAAALRNLFGS